MGGDSENIQTLQKMGISVYRIPQLRKYISIKREVIVVFQLIKIISTIKPYVVHTHLAKAGVLGRFCSIVANVPIIIHTVHGPSFPDSFGTIKRTIFKFIEYCVSKKTDKFVFVGKELADTYIREGVAVPSKAVVLKTGRPKNDFRFLEAFDAEKRNQIRASICSNVNRFLMIYVGRIVPSKQQDHAILILKRIIESGYEAELIVVGEAFIKEEKSYELFLKNIVDEHDLGDYVHFLGYRDDALKLMAVADAVILTSKYEGLPNVFVESLMLGTPFFSYAVSGLSEIMRYNEYGAIIPQNNINEFARRIMLLINQNGQKKASSRNSLKFSYFEEDMVLEKLKFYSNLLS